MKRYHYILIVSAAVLVAGLFGIVLKRNQPVPETAVPLKTVAAEKKFDMVSPPVAPSPVAEETVEPKETVSDSGSEQKEAVMEEDSTGISRNVQFILSKGDYKKRTQCAINNLPRHLRDADYNALADYLLTPQPGKDAWFRQYEYGLRNFMMGALNLDDRRVSDTVNILTNIFNDSQQGDIMRGYALQHLAGLHLEYQGDLNGGDVGNIVSVLSEAVKDRKGETISSTALVCLHEISMMNPDHVSPDRIEKEALRLINDPKANAMSLISAMQICGELGAEEAVPFARQTALNPDADWGMRVAAVYALSELTDGSGLKPLLDDSNKQVREAASMALRKRRS